MFEVVHQVVEVEVGLSRPLAYQVLILVLNTHPRVTPEGNLKENLTTLYIVSSTGIKEN